MKGLWRPGGRLPGAWRDPAQLLEGGFQETAKALRAAARPASPPRGARRYRNCDDKTGFSLEGTVSSRSPPFYK